MGNKPIGLGQSVGDKPVGLGQSVGDKPVGLGQSVQTSRTGTVGDKPVGLGQSLKSHIHIFFGCQRIKTSTFVHILKTKRFRHFRI